MNKPYNWSTIGDSSEHTSRSGKNRQTTNLTTKQIIKNTNISQTNMNLEQLQAAFQEQKQQFEAYKAQTEDNVQNQKILQTQWKTAKISFQSK